MVARRAFGLVVALVFGGDVLAATIGDRVWLDQNKNGRQDAGEPGVPGVAVELHSCNGALVASTTTNSTGKYSFITADGSYHLEFEASNSYAFTLRNIGADGGDSDPYEYGEIDGKVVGKTACVILTGTTIKNSWDAGLVTAVTFDVLQRLTLTDAQGRFIGLAIPRWNHTTGGDDPEPPWRATIAIRLNGVGPLLSNYDIREGFLTAVWFEGGECDGQAHLVDNYSREQVGEPPFRAYHAPPFTVQGTTFYVPEEGALIEDASVSSRWAGGICHTGAGEVLRGAVRAEAIETTFVPPFRVNVE